MTKGELMTTLDIKRLQSINGYPCISIIIPTHRNMPERLQDPIKIKNLVGQALDKLLREFSKKQIEPLAVTLDELVSSLDYTHLLDGIAIFVNKDIAEAHILPFHVREGVTVDDTFNLREIIYAQNRNPQAYVLLLSHKPTRLFKAFNQTLIEIVNDEALRNKQQGFPFEWQWDITSDRIKEAELLGEKDAGYLTSKKREFFQQIDKALDLAIPALIDSRQGSASLIIIGTKENCGEFMHVTKHASHIVVQGQGDYAHASLETITKAVAPLINAYWLAIQDEIVKKVIKAGGSSLLVTGIKEAWKAAYEGKVNQLVVEDNYKVCGYVNQAAPEELVINVNPKEPGVSDDFVDRLVELVIQKRGAVMFVKSGALKNYKQVAALLRF